MGVSRRRHFGGVRIAPPAAPSMLVIFPQSTTEIYMQWTMSPRATSYDVYYSTNGVSYSLYTNTASFVLSANGLTRNQIYYFKVKAKNASGSSAFSNVLYTWPVDTPAINYGINAIASDFSNVELNEIDLTVQMLEAGGITVYDLFNLMPFSPTAGANGDINGMMYDVSAFAVQDLNGGSVSSSGVYFNYDGYVSVSYPGNPSDFFNSNSFMCNIAVANLQVPGIAGYPNREVIVGSNNDYLIEFFSWINGATNSIGMVAQDLSSYAIDGPISFPRSGFHSFGVGADIHSGAPYVSPNPGTTTSSGAPKPFGFSPIKPLWIGALNDGGSPTNLSKFTVSWFTLGKNWINYADLLTIYYAEQYWNSQWGRP